MILGIVVLALDFHSVRSYLTLSLLVFVVGFVTVGIGNVYLLLIPAALLCAAAINWLVERWLWAFPKNPYAKYAGLAAICLLVGLATVSSYQRYVDLVATTRLDTLDISQLDRSLNQRSAHRIRLVANTDEQQFYQLFAHKYPNVTLGESEASNTDTVIALGSARVANLRPAEYVVDNYGRLLYTIYDK
jgi:hypothetical protein